MPIDAESKIIPFIRSTGPVVPAQVKKHLGIELLFASAMLAELVEKKKLKVSKLKIGGSPLYLIPGQESMLCKFADKLGEKDKRTYDLLEEHKVVYDQELDPLVRVSLRQLIDFAIPLTVTHNGKQYLYWKFFTTPDTEAEAIIKSHLGIEQEAVKPIQQEPAVIPPAAQKEAPVQQLAHEEKKEHREPETSADFKTLLKDEIRKEMQAALRQVQDSIKETLSQSHPSSHQETRTEQPVAEHTNRKFPKSEEQTALQAVPSSNDEFFIEIKSYFDKHEIGILDYTIIRKNAEIDCTILLPTAIGSVKYFCKAKSKKKIAENDLSQAYMQSQSKKLPAVFLTSGEISKKLGELAEKQYSSLIIKTL